jgi:uncharacterized protein YjbI with pentapeptide repeats
MTGEGPQQTISPEELVRRYDAGERDFRGLDMSGLKFRQPPNFAGADFSDGNFKGTFLGGAQLISCDLSRCDLTEADLSSAVLLRAILTGAKLSGATLRSTGLREAVLESASLENASLEGVDMSSLVATRANFSGSSLRSCNLDGARLLGANFSRARFHDSQLHNSDLSEANLEQSAFENVQFDGTKFGHVNLAGLVFIRSAFADSDLSNRSLRGAKFSATRFRGVKFDGSDLQGLEVDDQTNFTMCTFTGATIERNTLDSLSTDGGLTMGQLRSMRVVDGLSELRSNYSGHWQWLHLIALTVFLFPYVLYAFKLSLEAEPVCVAPGCSTIASQLWLFVKTGGKMDNAIAWMPFLIFWFSLMYNALRFVLLAKTKALELSATTAGFAPKFSLDDLAVPGLSWRRLLKAAKVGFFVNVVLVLLHLWHFMQMYVVV